MRGTSGLSPIVRAILVGLGLLHLGTGCARGSDSADPSTAVAEQGRLTLFEADELLHDVRDIVVDDSEGVWVLSGLEPFVHVYSPSGALVRRFGRRGSGPGEIRNPWSLFLPRDSPAAIGVWDVGGRKFVVYSPEGAPLGSRGVELPPSLVRADIREVSHGTVDALRAWEDGFVLQHEPRGVTHPFHILLSRLLRLDRAGMVVDTVVDFGERFHREMARIGAAKVMVPLPLWTTCPDGRLVYLDPFAPALVWHDSTGRERARAPVPASPRRIAEDDMRRYLSRVVELETRGHAVGADEIERRAARLVRSFRSWFPANAPPAVDLLCDPEGGVWLQRFSTADHPLGYGREWTVVSPSGSSRGVRFPRGFQPRVFTDGAVVGVLRDSLDVQRIASVALVSRPGGRGGR